MEWVVWNAAPAILTLKDGREVLVCESDRLLVEEKEDCIVFIDYHRRTLH